MTEDLRKSPGVNLVAGKEGGSIDKREQERQESWAEIHPTITSETRRKWPHDNADVPLRRGPATMPSASIAKGAQRV